ncbi:MAG TPA: hypothetical protein VM573_05675 [Actinomycetota bacterium]|nr:hypothetical protein [Actinomycetota bacterium]
MDRRPSGGDAFEADVPEADALEQKLPVDADRDSEDDSRRIRIAPDVPEADALEQARDADLDDESR